MAGIRKNREILTGGKRYAQKAAKKHRVEEVVFDKESRVEYLTGFHKRKLQRQKKAQEYIKEQERLNRIAERKEMRAERKKDMENQLSEFNKTMKDITNLNDSDDEEEGTKGLAKEWSGFSGDEGSSDEAEENDEDEAPKGILHHKEIYKVDKASLPPTNAIIDDETTVTVESLDNPAVASAREASLEAIAKANNVNLAKSEDVLEKSIKRAKNYAVVAGVAKPEQKKKKKFRYLSKAERRENTRKEKSKNKRPAK
ncbi:uncharacterized protein CANTADRAFT_27305 [Suhomyces tanzawaensis NRRL Y-17324]|uniref:Ribosomal RNA-processing protein 17 n=1 Tax=Suhomyces tanzawaensis NRRL Y-17324 TaxID=984487 RepID=A0A1E4SDD1_9ASCO|nr:uncharacterized protein CANTADRAFT_27305 [Suhomyces tanzawaensis NRRL Y-17324]ODV77527.1 hypothetical protein CANTADRAFT_27305 [Suhomyces tanzawaensis NRRL Y-17324]